MRRWQRGNIVDDAHDDDRIQCPGDLTGKKEYVADIKAQRQYGRKRTVADQVQRAAQAAADAEPLQAVQTFMDQHKAEQSRHDGRKCGDNGKVGDCRILQPGKLGNVIDADAKDAHGK